MFDFLWRALLYVLRVCWEALIVLVVGLLGISLGITDWLWDIWYAPPQFVVSPLFRPGVTFAGFVLVAAALVYAVVILRSQRNGPNRRRANGGDVPWAQRSIAVMPFVNIGADPNLEYFSDGITYDLINHLVRSRWFPVSDPNSTFALKRKAVSAREIGEALQVRYVLEGSVQKIGDCVRIFAEMVNAETGNNLWAKPYDCNFSEDIFRVQDEITREVAEPIVPALLNAEGLRAKMKHPKRYDALDCLYRSWYHGKRITRAENKTALVFAERAVELDPDYARAWSQIAFCHVLDGFWGWSADLARSLDEALKAAQSSVRLDPGDAYAHGILAFAYVHRGDRQKAISEERKALGLDPSDLCGADSLGLALIYEGKLDEAIPILEAGLKANPNNPFRWALKYHIGRAHLTAGRYLDAIKAVEEAAQINSDFSARYRLLAAAYAQINDGHSAAGARDHFLRLEPNFKLEDHLRRYVRLYRDPSSVAPYVDGMRKAWSESTASRPRIT